MMFYEAMICYLLFIYANFLFKGKPRIYWKAIRAISCSGEH